MESNKIDLFCGPNSLGVPYTRDNKNHFGYFDYVKQELEKLNYDVMGINFSSLNKNYTWDFEKMFKENYSLLQIKNIKISSIEEMRNANFLFKFVITEEYEDYLKKTSVDASKKIRTIYENSEKPIVFYSGGENDIFVFLQAGPVELLNPKIREKINNPLSYYVDKAIVNIKNNIDMLIYLNQNVDIYVLGAYNSPINNFIQKIINIYDKIKGNNLTKNMLSFLVKELNEKLYELCSNYNNVHYVNIEFLENHCASFDFHPNKEGNILIGSEIMKNLTENDIEKQKIKKL